MENYCVEDLMVPLSEYATVQVGCTLREAVLALEKAQEEFNHSMYKHRAILILDAQDRVIGKLNHLDALRPLIPKHAGTHTTDELSRFGFSNQFIRHLHRHYSQQAIPLEELCKTGGDFMVEDYMCAPQEEEFISSKADLSTAIHQMVQENLRSLLVKKEGNITGILRLSDLFSAVYHTMARSPDLA